MGSSLSSMNGDVVEDGFFADDFLGWLATIWLLLCV